jgi:hypothetical protein
MVSRGGYFLIEARWEHSRNAPGEDTFFMVDQIGGSLDDAKRTAQAYLDKHVASANRRLEWVAGITRKKPCHYAHTPHVTFRITS